VSLPPNLLLGWECFDNQVHGGHVDHLPPHGVGLTPLVVGPNRNEEVRATPYQANHASLHQGGGLLIQGLESRDAPLAMHKRAAGG